MVVGGGVVNSGWWVDGWWVVDGWVVSDGCDGRWVVVVAVNEVSVGNVMGGWVVGATGDL
jgi:hypothetical protein